MKKRDKGELYTAFVTHIDAELQTIRPSLLHRLLPPQHQSIATFFFLHALHALHALHGE